MQRWSRFDGTLLTSFEGYNLYTSNSNNRTKTQWNILYACSLSGWIEKTCQYFVIIEYQIAQDSIRKAIYGIHSGSCSENANKRTVYDRRVKSLLIITFCFGKTIIYPCILTYKYVSILKESYPIMNYSVDNGDLGFAIMSLKLWNYRVSHHSCWTKQGRKSESDNGGDMIFFLTAASP